MSVQFEVNLMLDVGPRQDISRNQETTAVQTIYAALTAVPANIIRLITIWKNANERFADLRSRCRSPSAHALVLHVRNEIENLEQRTGSRVRNRRELSGAKFSEAVERITGDLLRARVGDGGAGRIYRATGKDSFANDPVKYDVFWNVANNLKALDFIGHSKGQTRYRTSAFGPGYATTLPGRGARFWATTKLVKLAEAQAAADTLGLDVVMAEVHRAEDIAPAIAAAKGRADALYVATDPLLNTDRTRIAALAIEARLPTMCGFRELVEAGGLASYGPSIPDLFRRAADYVDKILRGAKPADLPVEQPTKFALSVNLATAKALGLRIPESFLVRADEVIE
jgi:hypothetical protein